MTNLELQKMANEVRKGIITGVHAAKAGHPGGSLSAADIFTYLYFEEMNIDPKDPKKADRDRFVLSKGHTAPGLYAALANRGYFPVEDLVTLRQLGSYLQGHPCMQSFRALICLPVHLGQGISAAVVWHWQLKWTVILTVYIHCLVMVRFRKARCGKLQCLPATESLTISVLS